MSADDYSICPRCVDNANAPGIRAADPEDFRTLREYHEFYGTWEMSEPTMPYEIVATYSSSCDVCNLTTKFEHRHKLEYQP